MTEEFTDLSPGPRRAVWVALLLAALVAPSCSASQPPPNEPTLGVRDLTGAHTRVVWVQNDGSDPRAQSDNLALAGFDTEDGRGERVILGERRNYSKPLLTPGGERIVFSNRHTRDLHIVEWDGTGLRRLAEGFGLTVWKDPADGREWVYAGVDPVDEGAFHRVVRFPIHGPGSSELVWDRTKVSEDSFQLSADGRLAGGMFPWPEAGVAELPNGSWRKLGEGCWTALAALDRPLLWYFDGAHRNLTLVDVTRDHRWSVAISRAPGFAGAEVYHPRWTNDPRFLTITGPYNLGGENQARRGGPQVEVYLGKFSADFARVDLWARVTSNDRGDAYPDVWVDPAALGSQRPAGVARAPDSPGPRAGGAAPGPSAEASVPRLVVEVRLAAPVAIPSPRAILPYRQALVVHPYEVVKVLEGRYAERTILVAHWAIRDGRILNDARKTMGTVGTLTVEPYDAHPELEGERLVMGNDDSGLPIYYDLGSR